MDTTYGAANGFAALWTQIPIGGISVIVHYRGTMEVVVDVEAPLGDLTTYATIDFPDLEV